LATWCMRLRFAIGLFGVAAENFGVSNRQVPLASLRDIKCKV